MKKVFTFVVALSLYACNEITDRPIELSPNIDNEIDQILNGQQGEVDVTNLETMLCSSALEMHYYYVNDSEDKTSEHKRFIFNEDGTMRILYHRVVLAPNDDSIENEYVDEYYYSRVYNWMLDKDSKTLITCDCYNNKYSATILYLSNDVIIYDGCIGDELRSVKDGYKYRTLAKFIDDRDSWFEVAQPFDVVFRLYADENDLRLKRMLELANSGPADSEKFIDAVLSSVISVETDYSGKESGCIYGDVCMYVYANGVYYRKDDAEGPTLPPLLVMFEDGVYRECFSSDRVNEAGPSVPVGSRMYIEYEWSYDTSTNTLYTNGSEEDGAKLLYINDNVAILKGHICGFPYSGEYGLFYIDFNKYDRDKILEEYNLNFRDLNMFL